MIGGGYLPALTADVIRELNQRYWCTMKLGTICLNSKVNGKQPSLEDRIYHIGGVAPAITTGFHYSILILYEANTNTNHSDWE